MNILLLIALSALTIYVAIAFLAPASNSKYDIKKRGNVDTLQKKKPIVVGDFTPRELWKYNGHDSEEIFIAVKGIVYDCTSARNFYGPLGAYSNFAGHDASRGLAKNSFDIDMFKSYNEPIDDLQDLTDMEREALDEWEKTYKNKYPVVGKLVSEKN